MLETEIKKLTAAVEANTAALGGAAPIAAPTSAAPAAAAPTSAAAATPAAAAASTAIDIPVGEPAADVAPVVAAPADLKMITEGIVALAKAKGREAAATLLAKYGAAKVPELKKVADQYDAIYADIQALIAG